MPAPFNATTCTHPAKNDNAATHAHYNHGHQNHDDHHADLHLYRFDVVDFLIGFYTHVHILVHSIHCAGNDGDRIGIHCC